MEFKIDGRKGFAGTIAVYEDIYGGEAMYGDSKAYEDTKTSPFQDKKKAVSSAESGGKNLFGAYIVRL